MTTDKITELLDRRDAACAAYEKEISKAIRTKASSAYISGLEQDIQIIVSDINRELKSLLFKKGESND